MESGYDSDITPEPNNLELIRQLEELISRDEEGRFHTPVVHKTFDKTLDDSLEIQEGNLVTIDLHDNAHLFLLTNKEKKEIIVISPPTAPATENQEELEAYYRHIGFDPRQGRFIHPFTYSYITTTENGITNDLAGKYFKDGMLLADSDFQQGASVRQFLIDAIAVGKSRISQSPDESIASSASLASSSSPHS